MTYPMLRKPTYSLIVPALAPALGGTVSVRASLVLGAVIVFAVVLTGPVNIVLAGRFPRSVRLVCTAIITITLATLARFVLSVADPALLASLGVFLPLVTVNVVVLRQAVLYEDDASRAPAKDMARSLWLALMLLGVLAGIGAVREILLTGALGETALLAIDLSFFGTPGGLLIVIGTILAAIRALTISTRQQREA